MTLGLGLLTVLLEPLLTLAALAVVWLFAPSLMLAAPPLAIVTLYTLRVVPAVLC